MPTENLKNKSPLSHWPSGRIWLREPASTYTELPPRDNSKSGARNCLDLLLSARC